MRINTSYPSPKAAAYFDYISRQNYSPGHVIHLKAYYRRHLEGKTFQDPIKLERYIQDQARGRGNIIKVARVYLNYCEKFESVPIEIIEKYRHLLNTSYQARYLRSNG